jgi:hypothetical protein
VLGLKQPKSHTAATGGRGALPMRCHSRHGEHACRRLRIGCVTVAPVPQAVLRQDLLATTKTDIHTHTEHGRHPTTTSETHEPESPTTNGIAATGRHQSANADTSDDAVPTEPPTNSTFQTTTVSNGTASGGKTAADKNQPWQCRAFTPRVKKQPKTRFPAFICRLTASTSERRSFA